VDESTLFLKQIVNRKFFRGKWKVKFLGDMSAPGTPSALYAHVGHSAL